MRYYPLHPDNRAHRCCSVGTYHTHAFRRDALKLASTGREIHQQMRVGLAPRLDVSVPKTVKLGETYPRISTSGGLRPAVAMSEHQHPYPRVDATVALGRSPVSGTCARTTAGGPRPEKT